MTTPAMLVDLSRCIGCYSCTIACKQENRLPAEVKWVTVSTREHFSPRWVRYYVSNSCRHCHQPACVNVCPTGALEITPSGVVKYNTDKCIGCRMCLSFCPNGALAYGESGKPSKCVLCPHRVEQGNVPACVQICPTSARIFGSRESILEHARQRIAELQEQNRPVELIGDNPAKRSSVLYLIPQLVKAVGE